MGLIRLLKEDSPIALLPAAEKPKFIGDRVYGANDSPEFIELVLGAAAVGTIYLRPEKEREPFSLGHLSIVADPLAAPFTVAVEWDVQVKPLPAPPITVSFGAAAVHPGGTFFSLPGLFWDWTLTKLPVFIAKELRIIITNGATPATLRVTPVILDHTALQAKF